MTEALVCEDMTSCTDLACHHVVDEIAIFCHCSTVLYSNSHYTVVASIFNPRHVGGGLQYFVGLCVCLSVCYHKIVV